MSIRGDFWKRIHGEPTNLIPWFGDLSYYYFSLEQRNLLPNKYKGIDGEIRFYADKKVGICFYAPQTYRVTYVGDVRFEEQNVKAREAYYACVDFVDDCIGKLIRNLDADGLLENTIIVYTADHGEQDGRHGIWDKGHHYENSVRSPLLMAGPGIPSGLRTQTMVGLYDIMPTLMDLCGLDIPDDLDGVSLTPFFNGHADFVPHNSIVTEYVAVTAVDRGNYRKSSGRPFPSFRAIITKRYKYSEPYESDGFNPTLFDLERDPDELVNRYRDPAYADVVQTLSAQLNQEHTTDEWAAIAAEDYARAQRECRDYIKPSMPNQYMLKDGRIFDAEKSLYDVRWLQTSNDSIYAGYIPQRLH